MMNKLRLLVGLFLAAAICAGGCGGDDDSNGGAPVPRVTEAPRSRTIADIVNLDAPGQTIYRWTDPTLSEFEGLVIYRSNGGTLRRWDETGASGDPPEGNLWVYKVMPDGGQVYRCIWLRVAGTREEVRAECSEGNSLPQLDLIGFPATDIEEELAERVVLGHPRRCVRFDPFDELCVDDEGRPLFMRFGTSNAQHIYEATFVSDRFEHFGWPFDPPATSIPSTFEETQPAEMLEFPGQFNLP
jgi:hypothetical protein